MTSGLGIFAPRGNRRAEPDKRGVRLLGVAWVLMAVSLALTFMGLTSEAVGLDTAASPLQLLSNAAAMAAASCALTIATANRGARYRHRHHLLATLPWLDAATLITFTIVHSGSREDGPLGAKGVSLTLFLAHVALYTTYLAWTMAEFHDYLSRLLNQSKDASPTCLGMRLTRVGVLVGYLWLAQTTISAIGTSTGIAAEMPTLSGILGVCSVAPLSLGTTCSFWIPYASRLAVVRWWQMHVLYRQLGPLWATIMLTLPQFTLARPGHASIRWKLHRRVIEIRDAQLFLAPYTPSQHRNPMIAAMSQGGLERHEHSDTELEAASIAAALQAYRSKQRAIPAQNQALKRRNGNEVNTFAEALELAEVAKAMRNLPDRLTIRS